MTYSPTIYDWRPTIVPVNQVFRAGGNSVSGGMTLGGMAVENPEAGGRGELLLEIAGLANANSNLDASWTVSRLLNGNIFRIKLFSPTVQLIADASLGGLTDTGVLWSNSLGWAGNVPWAFDPSVNVITGGAKGAGTIRISTTALGQYVQLGHVVGFHLNGYDFAHVVTDIKFPIANRADITLSPPLRRQVTVTDRLKLRPVMLATCVNAREVMGTFRYGTSMTLAPLRFVEALV